MIVEHVNRGGGGCSTLDTSPCNQDFEMFCPDLLNLKRYCEELGISICPAGHIGVDVNCTSNKRTP
jgi:hypothetical protein